VTLGTLYGIAIAVFFASAIGTFLMRHYAYQRLIDTPNERSSHTQPVPRGGGLALAFAFLSGLWILWWHGLLTTPVLLALVVGATSVAAIGFLDDHRDVPARVRFLVHLGAAIAAIAWIGPITQVQIGPEAYTLPAPVSATLSVFGLVWLINLFNFMDGIDGLAASEATLCAAGATLLFGWSSEVGATALLLATACLGFLLYNWAPARIFMGDVGSGFLGYVLGTLLLVSAQTNTTALWVWLLLLVAFWVDATVTLLRRLAQGKRWYVAHRSHVYQRLSRRWNSHAKVTCTYALMTTIAVMLAAVAQSWSNTAVWITLAASSALVACAWVLGAGLDD